METEQVTSQSANLFKNYNRVIGVAYTLIIVALAAYFTYMLRGKMDDEIDVIKGSVAKHGQFFEFVLRSSADELETFRMSVPASQDKAVDEANGEEFIRNQPFGEWLREDPERGIFHLDALPDRDLAGSIAGQGSLSGRDKDFYADLGVALRLNAGLSALVFTLPNATQASFQSVHNFRVAVPWQPSQSVSFGPFGVSRQTWRQGRPENNPAHEKYWPPVYFAGSDRGLVAPVAAPLYDGKRFIGVLSIDTSIDYLNRINSDFDYPLGVPFLVNERQEVLAHPQWYVKPLEVEVTPLLREVLPDPLLSEQDRILQLPSGQPISIKGYLVIRHRLVTAPWSLIYVVPERSLWWFLVKEQGGMMLTVLMGLVLVMALTYYITSREFVSPAAKLVQHIAAESNFRPATIPTVPTAWRPWFSTITHAFQESMKLMGLRQELGIAANMQQSILPQHWPQDERYALWGTMQPAKEVGGDFYDHFIVDGGLQSIVVADVSGKGIPAGLFGMVSKTLLRSVATLGRLSAGDLMAKANDGLAKENESCMFVTVFYAQFDADTGVLTYVNAGHPPPLVIHADGQVALLGQTSGPALGVVDGLPYQESSVILKQGDTLLMFSDGVTEAMNPAFEQFGEQRLVDMFTGHAPSDPQQAVETVLNEVVRFSGGQEQSDDITCVALHMFAKPSVEIGQEASGEQA